MFPTMTMIKEARIVEAVEIVKIVEKVIRLEKYSKSQKMLCNNNKIILKKKEIIQVNKQLLCYFYIYIKERKNSLN